MAAHADHGGVDLGAPGIVDYADHENTYLGFLKLLKWSTIGISILLIIVVYLIV